MPGPLAIGALVAPELLTGVSVVAPWLVGGGTVAAATAYRRQIVQGIQGAGETAANALYGNPDDRNIPANLNGVPIPTRHRFPASQQPPSASPTSNDTGSPETSPPRPTQSTFDVNAFARKLEQERRVQDAKFKAEDAAAAKQAATDSNRQESDNFAGAMKRQAWLDNHDHPLTPGPGKITFNFSDCPGAKEFGQVTIANHNLSSLMSGLTGKRAKDLAALLTYAAQNAHAALTFNVTASSIQKTVSQPMPGPINTGHTHPDPQGWFDPNQANRNRQSTPSVSSDTRHRTGDMPRASSVLPGMTKLSPPVSHTGHINREKSAIDPSKPLAINTAQGTQIINLDDYYQGANSSNILERYTAQNPNLNPILSTTEWMNNLAKNMGLPAINSSESVPVDFHGTLPVPDWLQGKSLPDSNLSLSDFTGANLSNTNLSHSKLFDINFSRTNLTNANLSGSSLIDSDLSNANLKNADLSHTNLTGANFTGANLENVKLDGAVIDEAAARTLQKARNFNQDFEFVNGKAVQQIRIKGRDSLPKPKERPARNWEYIDQPSQSINTQTSNLTKNSEILSTEGDIQRSEPNLPRRIRVR